MDNLVGASTETSYLEPETSNSAEYSESEDNGSAESVETEGAIASAETEDGGMMLVKDPVSGKVSLQLGGDTDSGEEDVKAAEETTEAQQNINQAPQQQVEQGVGTDAVAQGQEALNMPKYDLEEFSQALANGYVDPTRVPDEYQAQYADYRIRQAITARQAQEQRAAMEAERQRFEVEARMNPEARIQANKEFYDALEKEASAAAMRDIGITEEWLKENEFTEEGEKAQKDYVKALDWHKQRLRYEVQARYQQEQAYKMQQQQIYADISRFVDAERAKDSNFDMIDRTLATRYKTMPFEQGMVVAHALQALQNGTIDQRGVQIIQKYFQDCRKEFYAQKNGLRPNGAKPAAPKKPPLVENAGQGQKINRAYKPDYSRLRKANVDQRSAWFSEYFKNNGW